MHMSEEKVANMVGVGSNDRGKSRRVSESDCVHRRNTNGKRRMVHEQQYQPLAGIERAAEPVLT